MIYIYIYITTLNNYSCSPSSWTTRLLVPHDVIKSWPNSILLKKRWNEGTLRRFCRWSKQTQQTPWRRSFTAEDSRAKLKEDIWTLSETWYGNRRQGKSIRNVQHGTWNREHTDAYCYILIQYSNQKNCVTMCVRKIPKGSSPIE